MRATRWCGWRCSAARPWCYHAYAYCDGDSNPDRFANADTNWNSDDPDLEVYRLAGRVDHRPGDDEILADAVRRLRIYLYTGGGK
jgi:hypothetical protein